MKKTPTKAQRLARADSSVRESIFVLGYLTGAIGEKNLRAFLLEAGVPEKNIGQAYMCLLRQSIWEMNGGIKFFDELYAALLQMAVKPPRFGLGVAHPRRKK